MTSATTKKRAEEIALAKLLAHCRDDPVLYVETMYPWGQPGPLASKKGPRRWQREVLESLRDDCKGRDIDALRKSEKGIKAIKYSMVTGHGSGKSALLSWICLWLFDTRPYSAGSMTAPTGQQMRGRFFRELNIWRGRGRTAHLSQVVIGNSPKLQRIGAENEWKLEGYSPKKELSEAFAGQHSADSASYYIFDEASGVHDEFYRVCQGGLMDSEPFVFAAGNGMRSSGFFWRSHHQKRTEKKSDQGWRTFSVDSRTVEGINLDEIESIIDEFGEASDTVRSRIKGLFPNSSDMQFFPVDLVDWCQQLPDGTESEYAPYLMGVDVAHSGSDKSVIVVRKGRNCRDAVGPISWWSAETNTTDEMANRIAMLCSTLSRRGRPVLKVFMESLGVGVGVYDRCKQLGIRGLTSVNGAQRASPSSGAANLRAEMFINLRNAMKEGLMIPDTDHPVVGERLRDDLLGMNGYPKDDGRIMMESKKDMRARGRKSSDFADALALTFAQPVFAVEHPYGVDWERQLMHNENQARLHGASGGMDIRERLRRRL